MIGKRVCGSRNRGTFEKEGRTIAGEEGPQRHRGQEKRIKPQKGEKRKIDHEKAGGSRTPRRWRSGKRTYPKERNL